MSNIYRYSICLVLCFLCFAGTLRAQQVPVSIKVMNVQREPVVFATVTVISSTDSSKILSAITDTSATAFFSLDSPAHYQVRITALNYRNASGKIAVGEGIREFVFTLEPDGKALDEVTVQAVRSPLMRQDGDKTVIDPESLAAASTNGYEVLEKTPGIFVDQDGNIYLSSTTPATVYINGREMKMSRTDIATMLKSLPPNAIERIEILRTPSAKFDASGSGGVVNVVLRKGIKVGLTGSATAGFQQGKYGNQFAGINLANNDGTSLYLNLNYTRRNSYDILNTERFLGADTLLSQQARTTYPGNAYFMGYGASRDWKDKWSLGYDGRLSFTNSFNRTLNNNSFIVPARDEVLGTSVAALRNDTRTFVLNQDIASRYKIDSAGSEWSNSFSYIYAVNTIGQDFNTQSLMPYSGDGKVSGKRHFVSGQTDLAYKFAHRITMETGLKSTYLDFNNDAAYFLSYNGLRTPDNTRTNTYNYRENINSAYLQASKGLGNDILLKAGIRMENTNMEGRQTVPSDTTFRVRRTDFFPYVYLSKKVMMIAKYELRAYLVYRRTISRPTYEQLNPFPRYVDQFLSETGNPRLRPQFTHNYEANISVDERPLLAIGINDTKDMFTNVYYQADSSRAQAFRTYDNIGTNREFYLRGLGAIPPGGTYFFVIGGQYNYNVYNGLYEGKPLSFKRGGFLFFTYHQLKLDPYSQITLNGFLRLKGPLQFYELSSFGALNLSVNRKFFKQKLIVTLSANDIFFTNNNKFLIEQGSVDASGYRESDSRRFGINIRYQFGLRKKEEEKDLFNLQSERSN